MGWWLTMVMVGKANGLSPLSVVEKRKREPKRKKRRCEKRFLNSLSLFGRIYHPPCLKFRCSSLLARTPLTGREQKELVFNTCR
eukprot:scaffold336_cov196-Amphora_coffeaeformis.AAC.16